ncbi:MAG: hypothetical protein ACYCV7_14570, partial [Acidimicrobiales bacterium]
MTALAGLFPSSTIPATTRSTTPVYHQASGCNTSMPVEEGGATPTLVGPLTVPTGSTQICDAGNDNAPVLLRGVVRSGLDLIGNGQLGVNVAPTAAEINGMHAWGANFVRVMLSADFVDQALLGRSC